MVAAVILAAGHGRRLGGTCKATLAVPDGRSFLEAILECATAAGIAEAVIVTGAPHTGATTAEAARLGVACVKNPDPARGMGSSVAIGFAHAQRAFADHHAALLWPVDHPYVKKETVGAIVSASVAKSVVIPVFDRRGGHPAAFGRALWPALSRADSLPQGARSIVRAATTRTIRLPTDDPGVVSDVDVAGDLR